MSKSKYCNNYIPPAIAGEVYMKGGRIKVPPPAFRPPKNECVKLVNAMIQQGLVSFQGKEDEDEQQQ
jgi:hypothetical protein